MAIIEPQLALKQVSMGYGDVPLLERLDLTLMPGEIACLLGPSGSGKSSLLRAIAGFEPIQKGEIIIHQQLMSSPKKHVQPEKRQTGMVFQDFALFPHLTVEDNIRFGLRRLSKPAQQARIDELLNLIELDHIRTQYPHEISGGQQQRVALARAMAPRPDLILLDEPFSSMDTELRTQLAKEVGTMLRRDGMTALMVTHDQQEAYAMADHVGVLGEGRLHQWGRAYDLYHRPVDRFVADFIGEGVFIKGSQIDDETIQTELGLVRGDWVNRSVSGELQLLLRPDDVLHDDLSPLKADILAKDFRGPVYLYTLRLESGQLIYCLVQSHHDHSVGGKLGIRLNAEHLAVFSPTN